MNDIIELYQSVSFPIKFIIGVLFFAPYLRYRTYFVLRTILSILVCFVACIVFKVQLSNHGLSFIYNAGVFILLILGMSFCFKNSFFSILFCGAIILAIQQIAFNILTIVYLQVFLGKFIEYLYEPIWFSVLWHLIHVLLCTIFYWLMDVFYMKKIEFSEEKVKKNKAVILVVLGLVELIFLCYHSIMGLYVGGTILYINMYIIVIICCLFALGYLFGIFKYNKVGSEVEIMKKILSEKEKHYALSRENVDLINRKCHDLKYVLARYADKRDDKELNEMAEAVNIYSTVPKTGNIALEVILSENYLFCKNNKINFACIADGSLLKFMQDSDVYTLIGNAVSNAIDANLKVAEGERYININIGKASQSNLIGIMIENSFDGNLKFNNGEIESSKEKNGYHGYGMKSMEFIVEKYGGGFSYEYKEKRFYINIVLPLSVSAS